MSEVSERIKMMTIMNDDGDKNDSDGNNDDNDNNSSDKRVEQTLDNYDSYIDVKQ